MKQQQIILHMILSKCNRSILDEITNKVKETLEQENHESIIFDLNFRNGYVAKYWKYEGAYEFFLEIPLLKDIKINDFTKLFDISWHCTDQCNEDAIWNKVNQAAKIFLHPSVDWVHAYMYDGPTEAMGPLPLNSIELHTLSSWFYATRGSQLNELNILADFLINDIGPGLNKTKIEAISNIKHEELGRCAIRRMDNSFIINYPFEPEVGELVINVDDLIKIIQCWQELSQNESKKIILDKINGKIEIRR